MFQLRFRYCVNNTAYFRDVNAKSKRSIEKMLPSQCRMARAALNMGVRDLANAAQVSTNTITRFEKGDDDDQLKPRTVEAIARALQAAGVTFIDGAYSGSGGPGVRLFAPTGDSIDTNEDDTIQYKDMFENDAPPGAGG
ncbi:helix-turn-helix transcriptional regulator [Rhizobium sp. BE258]|uniref:helix-turn-helix domain-containing protein n=1 Tax=Rhizobium sp. BE258 TaxID=2817722 RepID=UPI0028574C7E|nr:helix-turn-helix transcriptional regulator [Rhizobium sp. BE258]MDR7148038.1 transcriptional regulator with XRE-family HTH domain [Rhizobium sp. BE258]